MAKKKVVKKSVKKGSKRGETNYKWDTWLNGKPHLIKAGVDFTCATKSFIHYLKKRAIVAGKQVDVKEYLSDGSVRIQVTGKYKGKQTNPLQTGRSTEKKTTKKKVPKKSVKKTKKKAVA